MPADPFKYFVVTDEPGNVVTGAYQAGASASGLTDGKKYEIQNLSGNDIFYEERETSATSGPGKHLASREVFTYEVNADSPLFMWTTGKARATIAIGPAID